VSDAAVKARLTSLFPNDVLDRLERLRINSQRRFTNKSRGEHLSGKGGQSIEFSDYRDYTPGDDVRFVDWNIFARLHRPYLKLYHQEEEMHVAILVDASASMRFEGKLERAKQLGVAFGVMGLLAAEKVSVYAFNSVQEAPGRLPPCTGRASMTKTFRFIEQVEPGGDAPVEMGIEAFLRFHSGRGIAVVLSDFLTFTDLTRAFNLLFSSGLELMAVQILGPTEMDPDVAGDLRFVDSETQTILDVSSANDLVDLYQEYRLSYERRLTELSQQRSGRFLSICSQDPLDWVLFDLLPRTGWVQ
jgi:uncharacterized protein (DUF58 family)